MAYGESEKTKESRQQERMSGDNKPKTTREALGKDDEGNDRDGSAEDEGVVVPEDFQKQTHELLKNASTKHHLSHVRSMLNQHEDKMRDKENEDKAAMHPKGKVDTFTTSAMPDY